MKRAVYVGMIFLSVMMIFAAAEMLPQIVIRYNDRERNNQIILEEDVAAAGKIAYELSESDKLKLLTNTNGILEESSFTKVYEARSRDNLDEYDPAVLEGFGTSVDTMKTIGILSDSVSEDELKDYLTDACCVSVDSGQNGMGSLTIWVLTFQENSNRWQFVLDVSEKKLYGMYISTRESVKQQYVSLETERLQQYYGGRNYDGYWIEISASENTRDFLYIPMKAETIEKKENAVVSCVMLGEELFYQCLSKVVEDLAFSDFCHPIEIENENFAENDESAEEMDLKKK